jgi:hypothetical protein
MQRILAYGTSIFLAGLAAQLQTRPGMQVRCHSRLSELGDLAAFDVVLVDLDDAHAVDVLSMWRARPDLRVIGVNSTSKAVSMLSVQVYLAQNVEDVITCLARAGQCGD